MMRDKNKKKICLLKRKHKKKMQISIIINNTISLKHFKTETRFFNFLILEKNSIYKYLFYDVLNYMITLKKLKDNLKSFKKISKLKTINIFR